MGRNLTETLETTGAALPFYHVAGLIVTHLIEFVRGSRMILMPKFHPTIFLECIQKFKVI